MLQIFYDSFMKAISSSDKGKATTGSIHGLKLPVLIILALLTSGCGLNQLKQREVALNEQQLALTEQLTKLEEESQRLASLEETLNQEKNRLEVMKKSLGAYAKTEIKQRQPKSHLVIGELENVYLTPPDIELTARIDTGANTSSLNALDMVEFERDGKAHVRFNIIDPKTDKKIEIIRRVIGHVRIKEHDGESQSRPIVKMRVRLGNLDQPIKMTLADRSVFRNQVLIGRNFLRDYAIVDVSQKFQTSPVINDE